MASKGSKKNQLPRSAKIGQLILFLLSEAVIAGDHVKTQP
jgi:hypothetical protein